ncbi:MAG: hypothetical protein Q4C43_03400 [Prevotella sp.]|nr:hypothetical protein [Prevotella sp.]
MALLITLSRKGGRWEYTSSGKSGSSSSSNIHLSEMSVLPFWQYGYLAFWIFTASFSSDISILPAWQFGLLDISALFCLSARLLKLPFSQIAILPFGMEMDIPACFARWKKVDMVIPELPERRHLSYWDSAASGVHPA